MEAEVPIATRQRVAAFAVIVEARGTGDQDPAAGPFGVVDAFQQIPPPRIFVDLIEEEQRLCGWQLGASQPRWHSGVIPTRVRRVLLVSVLAQEAKRERRLANLSRAADDDHLLRHGRLHRGFEVAGDAHGVDNSPLHFAHE